MSAITINLVAAALKQAQVEPAKIREVVEIINHEVADDGDEKAPAIKKQHVVLLSDPEGTMPARDYVAWVLQIPEDVSVMTALERVHRGAYDFNVSKKGRLMPAKTVGDAIENVSAKFFKEAGVWIKTKTPVLVVKTDNSIPKDDLAVVKGSSLE